MSGGVPSPVGDLVTSDGLPSPGPGWFPADDGGPAPATTTGIDRNLANQVGSDHFS